MSVVAIRPERALRTAPADPEGHLLTAYRRDGYALVPGVLPVDDLDTIAAEMNAVYASSLRRFSRTALPYSGQASLLANMRALFECDLKAYLAATRHAGRLASLQHLVVNEAVCEITAALGLEAVTVPSTPVLHVMADTLKIPGGYHGVAPHQDWPVVQGGLDSVVMWFSLFDVGPRCYPLAMIPRSHLRGVWPSRTTEHACEVDADEYVDSDFVPVEVRRGDLLVFTTFTVHRTTVQDCSGLRIAASMRYENSAEPTFAERGYPCTYQRVVTRETLFPGFPSAEQVRRVLLGS